MTVTKQTIRVWEVRSERDVAGLIVEVGFDGADPAGLRELLAIRQSQFDDQLIFVRISDIFQVA